MNQRQPVLLRGLPAPVRHGAELLAVGFTIYFWLTFSGPYRWLAEQQMEWLDGYYAIMTIALTVFVLLVPLAFALQLARRLGVLGDPAAGSLAGAGSAASSGRAEAFNAFVRRHQVPLMLAGAAMGLLFFAGRGWLIARRGAELEQVALSALEAGGVPRGSWLEVNQGQPVWDAQLEWRDGHATQVYVPLLSPAWQEGRPVALVLSFSKAELVQQPAEATVFRGAVMPESLPAPVQVAYRESGFETAQALVLSVGVDPRAMNDGLGLLLALGLGLLVLAAGVYVWQQRGRLR